LIDVTERWKIGASASYLQFPVGEKSAEWRVSAQQRYTLHQNLALRFDFNQRDGAHEYLLGLQLYF
jgi:hypothetical protein